MATNYNEDVVNYTKNVLYDLCPWASTIKLFECDVG